MKIKIYQINSERDAGGAKFMGLDMLEKYGIQHDRSIYDCVFDGAVDTNGLDEIFYIFNAFDRTAREFWEHIMQVNFFVFSRMHSLSVSDVVEMDGKFFYCDSIGWRLVDF